MLDSSPASLRKSCNAVMRDTSSEPEQGSLFAVSIVSGLTVAESPGENPNREAPENIAEDNSKRENSEPKEEFPDVASDCVDCWFDSELSSDLTSVLANDGKPSCDGMGSSSTQLTIETKFSAVLSHTPGASPRFVVVLKPSSDPSVPSDLGDSDPNTTPRLASSRLCIDCTTRLHKRDFVRCNWVAVVSIRFNWSVLFSVKLSRQGASSSHTLLSSIKPASTISAAKATVATAHFGLTSPGHCCRCC
mmetsp:Transcript_136622/g.237210  ORF Transcript_136622/g.237210 Transcript_136622/m.237210 type:complete len:248 (-) Transcript_136622:351-1094(-)